MEFGALVCKSRTPSCLLCPFPDICLAYRTGIQEVIPRPKKRSYRIIETVVAVIPTGGKYLIQKRPPGAVLAGLWEFPGGKREPGESLEAALRREIREELGAKIGRAKFLLGVEHAYTQFQVRLSAFECSLKSVPKLDKSTHRWVTLRSLRHYPFHSGSSKIVDFLENRARMEA
jgi:A/G-specific adenine glycosylase